MAPAPPAGFADRLGLPSLYARLLYNRGVRTPEEARAFLEVGPDMEHDPALMPGMAPALRRLWAAIEAGEVIGVYGDFDVDGISGTAVLTLGLRELGGRTIPYLPNREAEGHGLNADAVRELADAGATVCVTVDCGVTDLDEVGLASQLGIDTIITDHHSPEALLPPACAVVHAGLPGSRYPFKDLTGAGMAYKLVAALFESRGLRCPEHLLELVALGTVADVGPMEGENRYFVSRGLKQLNRTGNTGLRALMESAKVSRGTLDEVDLAFSLIPRLNAAGRIGTPKTSLDLLTTTSPAEGQQLAAELEYLNQQRRSLTDEAMSLAEEQTCFPGRPPPIIILSHPDWHPGILGPMAGQLSDEHVRPVIVASKGPEISRASARSIPELNMVDALRSCEDLLIRYGGHPLAAGFAARTADLPEIERRLRDYASDRIDPSTLTPTLDIDCQLPLNAASTVAVQFVESLAPFGHGNPRPTFVARGVSVAEARRVGGDGRHLKLSLFEGGALLDAIAFRMGDRSQEAYGRIDVVYTPTIDVWRGRRRVQLTLQDFAASARL